MGLTCQYDNVALLLMVIIIRLLSCTLAFHQVFPSYCLTSDGWRWSMDNMFFWVSTLFYLSP